VFIVQNIGFDLPISALELLLSEAPRDYSLYRPELRSIHP